MSIEDWSDEQVSNLEQNYRRADKIDGGKYSLAEVLLEMRRRNAGALDSFEVYRVICEKSAASADGLVTYGEIWQYFFPDTPWSGNNPRKVIGKALGGVIYYCHTHDLPLMNVLVVRKGTRKLSAEAIQNIWQECKELGRNPGPDQEKFVLGHMEDAKEHAKSLCDQN